MQKIIAVTIIIASLLLLLSLIISDSGADGKVIQPAWDIEKLINQPVDTTANVNGINYTIKDN
ncbi:hypothetical protein U472_09790 [Orenia metallireducens]|jgi:hypothetical protein|uniref:Uncharacterized protein n=1 Tax=Orenia metallireducens TaxID=1413210 RepID=A0A1C0A7R1_9FIRM|nr:hypothetical protein [Orenia metallireducens]OCL26293.1 hypothetical protein U472_09790 [Orenia metallireducens]